MNVPEHEDASREGPEVLRVHARFDFETRAHSIQSTQLLEEPAKCIFLKQRSSFYVTVSQQKSQRMSE